MSNVNHPKHYNTNASGIECIEVVRHMNFNKGNAIKYVWRAGDKGKEIEDLEKAIWYLQDEIKRLKNNRTPKAKRVLSSRPQKNKRKYIHK
jgi:hypothetical protein